MNTPVNFELAKLLKGKGYPQPKTLNQAKGLNISFNWYNEDGIYNANYKLDTKITAPTIAEVVMWLYEKHGIWLYVSKPYENGWVIHWQGLDIYPTLICYNTPTEAYEAAIEYILNNLI